MNTIISNRLAALRDLMKQKNIDVYLVPTGDFHSSEYVCDHFKCREYLSGFSGSAGTLVIKQEWAGLWTDGRYFLQADQQLKGTGIELMKMGQPGVPSIHEFLKNNLIKGQRLGFDGRVVSAAEAELFEKELKSIHIDTEKDLVGEIWKNRPPITFAPAWSLDLIWCGKERKEKIEKLRADLKGRGADALLLTSLEDICWLLNIRGDDIKYTPVVLSYLYIDSKEIILFANEDSFSEQLTALLSSAGLVLRPYNAVYSFVTTLPRESSILLSKTVVNSLLVKNIPSGVRIIDDQNPTLLPKAVKNETEVRNEKAAHIKDGTAVTKFIYWLKKNVGHQTITELDAMEQLYKFRKEQENFLGNSFSPIIAYGYHASIVHYGATEKSNIPLEARGLLLADTGGHYLEGTTDTTRTIVLGPVTEEEKYYFTLVLKGNLRLAGAKFLQGCTGENLDYLARSPLWQIGKDYNHGTGHGVGYLLSVHEGPNSFRWKSIKGRPSCVFEEGMFTSDEPGYYADGKFGIRHENMVVCKKAEKTSAGQFLCFETLTMVPFDRDAIIPELLDPQEKELLNTYHKTVYDQISPYLDQEEKLWLEKVTAPL